MEMARWGDFKFKVNSDRVFSFRGMQRSYGGRWSVRDTVSGKPRAEFLGPSQASVTMEVVLDAELGVRPRKLIRRFRRASEEGWTAYFYIGGKKVGNGKYYLESGADSWDEIWNRGELVRATTQLTFKEYH